MATRVMIPASPDGLKPRAPPVELVVVDEDGFEVDPVDEGDPPPEDEEELAPTALAYGDVMSVMKDKLRGNNFEGTLKASNVLSAVGFTAKTIPASQCLRIAISDILKGE